MKRKILFLLFSIIAPTAFIWGQTYTYTYAPALGQYTTCSSGDYTTSTINYSGCYISSGTTAYANGHIQSCLYSHNPSTGQMVFRVKKCSGNFANGNSGKIFVYSAYSGEIIGCQNFTITNSTTSYISVPVTYNSNFTGNRNFRIFLVTSDGVYKQYGGQISINGIEQEEECYCSPLTQLTASSGSFDDGSGSSNYANNSECLWLIQPANASSITLTFNSFNTQSGHDYVRVYDGASTSSTLLLGEFSGSSASSVTSSGGLMTVKFTSDGSGTASGWSASYTSQICYCSGRTTLTSSSGTLNDGSGSSNYANNTTCEWLIQPPGVTSITLSFNSFNTQSGRDYVYVYDGSSTTAAQVSGSPFSGTTIPSGITSSGGSLLVRFVTDGSGTRSGWDASYTSSTGSVGCTYSDCSTGNCGNGMYLTSQEVYTAAQYLCGHNVIDPGNGSGPLRPDDNITRGELAKIALYGLYDGYANVPNPLVTDYFPSIYPDLQDQTTFYYRAAKAMLYLEYGDGVTPFDRNRSTFNPEGTIERNLVLKVLMETFNIAPYSGSSTSGFSDYSSTEPHWAYAKRAKSLGITTGTTFRPYDMCTRAEAFMFLYRIMTSTSITRPTPTNTSDTTSSFFIPNNLSPQTINAIRGIEYGNFQYEEKECFSNPGWIDMDFNLVYNSVMDELPDDFCPINPLGTKVWNHTYNMYMNVVHNEYLNEDWLVFHLAGDKYLIYKGSSLESMTDGNYNTLTRQSSSVYKLKTVDQVEYTFQKLLSAKPIYYLTSICNRFGDCVNINYETSGSYKRITSVTSGSGSGARTYTFSYASGSDRLSQVTDPLNRTVRLYYNSDNRLSQYQDAKGNNTYYTYGLLNSEKNLLKTIQLPNGNTVNNNYRLRKLTSTQNNSSPATSIQQSINYANTGDQRYTSTVTEPMTSGSGSQNLVTHYTTNERGQVVHMYDNCNVDITRYYENTSHPELPSREVDSRLGVTTSYTYSSAGLVTRKSISASGISFNEQDTYNATNDITSHTDPNGNTTHYNYNTSGALTSVVDAAGHTTNITNNSHGRPTSIQNPQGVTTNYTYNVRGLVTQVSVPAASLSSSYAYDAAGRLTSSTDDNGNTTSYAYDANDNITSITDAANHTTSMTYDANDNMTRVTNARGYYTQLAYDDNDFNTSQTFQGHTKTFTYYNNGALHTMTSPNNNTLTFTYNNSGQVTSTGYASYSYGSNGLPSSITKDSKSITYGYDGIGRVTSVAYDGKTVGYTYDNVGNILTIVYPGNKTVTYTYNSINQMTSVKDWNNHTTNYNYRNDGQLNYVQYPNNVRTTYSYDNAGRRTGQVTKRNSGSGTVIAQYTYTLDDNGNHLSESVTEPYTTYPTILSQTTNYTYGNDNRLLTAGDKTFSYDNNGNTTAKTGRNMTYDVLDNLTGVSGNFTASYTYDGLGNRRTATRSGTMTKYVLDILQENANVLMETNSGGTVQHYYVYGADGLVSRIGSNGSTTHYYVADPRGSIVAMTDATTGATVTHQYQYDEFGNLLQSQEADANPFRYVGKYGVMYEDGELYFMRARYYDPETGRFLSEDPIWSSNLYLYAENNPIVYIDPSGNAEVKYNPAPYAHVWKPKVQTDFERNVKDYIITVGTYCETNNRLKKGMIVGGSIGGVVGGVIGGVIAGPPGIVIGAVFFAPPGALIGTVPCIYKGSKLYLKK